MNDDFIDEWQGDEDAIKDLAEEIHRVIMNDTRFHSQCLDERTDRIRVARYLAEHIVNGNIAIPEEGDYE